MDPLKDKQVNVMQNFKEIVEIKSEGDIGIPRITTDEVRKAAKGTTCGKAAGEDAITADLIKDGGDIIFEKLA